MIRSLLVILMVAIATYSILPALNAELELIETRQAQIDLAY